ARRHPPTPRTTITARFARRLPRHRPRRPRPLRSPPTCSRAPAYRWPTPARPDTAFWRRITLPNTTLGIVCLPKATPTEDLATTAIARLGSSPPPTQASPAGHFPVTTRLRRGSLVQPWHATAAGGPIRLLDLDAMRTSARNACW